MKQLGYVEDEDSGSLIPVFGGLAVLVVLDRPACSQTSNFRSVTGLEQSRSYKYKLRLVRETNLLVLSASFLAGKQQWLVLSPEELCMRLCTVRTCSHEKKLRQYRV